MFGTANRRRGSIFQYDLVANDMGIVVLVFVGRTRATTARVTVLLLLNQGRHDGGRESHFTSGCRRSGLGIVVLIIIQGLCGPGRGKHGGLGIDIIVLALVLSRQQSRGIPYDDQRHVIDLRHFQQGFGLRTGIVGQLGGTNVRMFLTQSLVVIIVIKLNIDLNVFPQPRWTIVQQFNKGLKDLLDRMVIRTALVRTTVGCCGGGFQSAARALATSWWILGNVGTLTSGSVGIGIVHLNVQGGNVLVVGNGLGKMGQPGRRRRRG